MDFLSRIQRILRPIKVKTRKYYGKIIGFDDFHFVNNNLMPFMYSTKDKLNFLDIGAAHGEMTLAFIEKFPDFNYTMCFEPNPNQFKTLSKRLAKLKNIETVNIGLGSENKEIEMDICTTYGDASSFLGKTKIVENMGFLSSKVNVKVEKLDNYLLNYKFDKIHLIKMDVEGYELEVLKGAVNTLKNIENIYIEICHLYHPRLSRHLIDVFDFLNKQGFSYIGCYGDYFFTKNEKLIDHFFNK